MTGSGTSSDPYVIYDVNDLQAINTYGYFEVYYELANDIDASATSGWNGGAGFMPIGEDMGVQGFVLDGKGFTIDGIFINRKVVDVDGSLGFISAAWGYASWPNHLKNLNLTNFTVKQDSTDTSYMDSMGIICGWTYDINLEFIEVTDSYAEQIGASGLDAFGGLFGDLYVCDYCHDVNISSSTLKVTTWTQSDFGGWAGSIGNYYDGKGEVYRCYAKVTMYHESKYEYPELAGFVYRVGWGSSDEYPIIHDCFCRTVIRWNNYNGWNIAAFHEIMGAYGSTIRDCYAVTDVITYGPWPQLIVTTTEEGEVIIEQGYPHTTEDAKNGLHPDRLLYDWHDLNYYHTSWNAAHDAVGDNYWDEGDSEWRLRAGKSGTKYKVTRGAMFFDTSPLDGLTITSAKLRLLVETWIQADSGGATIHLVAGPQNLPVVDSDFQALRDETVSLGSQAWIADYDNDPHYVEVTLNGSGLAHINQTGLTKFGIRLAQDLNDVVPTGENSCYIGSNFEHWDPFTYDGVQTVGCFFDNDVVRYPYQPDWFYDEGGSIYPRTTAEMKSQETFTSKGWDFAGTWFIDENINDGYPFFKPFAEALGPIWM